MDEMGDKALFRDFLKKLLHYTDDEQIDLIKKFEAIMNEHTVREINQEIMNISDDPNGYSRAETLEKLLHYSKSVGNHYKKDENGIFVPQVRPRNVVLVDFSGMGSEMSGEHYAIVWEAIPKRDHLIVIPTTSYKDDLTKESGTYFNIGKVGFLEGETVVKLDQTTAISRKRILSYTHVEPGTGRKKWVSITEEQEKRIQEGIRVLWFKEKTLYHVILRSNRHLLPILEDEVSQFTHLHRPIIIKNPSTDRNKELIYCLYNDEREYKIQWKPTSLSPNQREKLIKDWVHALAEYKVDEKTGDKILVKTREQSISDAYALIKRYALASSGTET